MLEHVPFCVNPMLLWLPALSDEGFVLLAFKVVHYIHTALIHFQTPSLHPHYLPSHTLHSLGNKTMSPTTKYYTVYDMGITWVASSSSVLPSPELTKRSRRLDSILPPSNRSKSPKVRSNFHLVRTLGGVHHLELYGDPLPNVMWFKVLWLALHWEMS